MGIFVNFLFRSSIDLKKKTTWERLWKHEHMIRLWLWSSNVIIKAASKKRIAAWGEADFMPINWNPFYDTFYDNNQIT